MKERLISTQEAAYEYPYPTMDMYVHGLKNSLKQEGDGGKTLVGWLSTISLMSPEEHREVKATLQTKQGRGPIYELNSSHQMPEEFSEETPTQSVLEANGLVRAKLELIKGMDNVPWNVKAEASKVIKKAENEASLILDKTVKKGLPNKQTKLGDIFDGINITRRKLITSVLPTLLLVACSPVVAKPIEPSPINPGGNISPTVEVTDIPVNTPEPTDTPTPEISPTPEMVAADPTNIDSWPEKYKNFYVNNPEDQSMDNDFQAFMDMSRKDYLSKAGIQGVENMNSDELLWQMIKQSAKEKKELMITPLEIVDIVTDPEVDQILWHTKGGASGIWQTVKDPAIIYHFQNYSYETTVYGRNTLIPRYGLFDITSGEMLNVVHLPGEENSKGLLMQIKEQNTLKRHLLLFQIYENEPTNGYTCFNHNTEIETHGFETFKCNLFAEGVRTLPSKISDNGEIPENITSENIFKWIKWPPYNIVVNGFYSTPEARNGRIGHTVVTDNVSGLEVLLQMKIFSTELSNETEQ